MASNRVGSLHVLLSADTGDFKSKMAGAAATVDKTGKRMGAMAVNVAQVGAAFAAAAVGGMALFVRSALISIDATAKLASQLQVSTQALTGYDLAAQRSGVSMDSVGAAILKMNENLGSIKDGTGTAVEGLTLLGKSVTDLEGLNTQQKFEAIADSIKGIEDPTLKAAAANKIFGGDGVKILNFLENGSAGFAKIRQETEGFGTSLRTIDAKKVEIANDAFGDIKQVIDGAITQLTVRLAPILTVVSRYIVDMAKDSKGFGTIWDSVINFAIKGFGFILDTWNGLLIAWNLGKIAMASIGIAGNEVINGLTKGFNFIAAVAVGVWDRLKFGFQSVGAFIGVVWGNIKLGIATFVQFVGNQIAELLNNGSAAARNIKGMGETADGLAAAAAKVAGATGGAIATAKTDLAAAESSLASISGKALEAGTNLQNLFTGDGPEMAGSEDAVARIALLEQMKQEAITTVVTIAETERASVSMENALAAGMAQANAEAAQLALVEDAKTQNMLTSAEERNIELSAQQAAYLEMFGNAEAAAVDKNKKLWESGMRGRAQVVGGVLGQIGKLMESGNKTQFKIGKAAAIGSTTIATVEASMQAYKSLAGIPIVGPGLGIAAAAAATLSGINAVNQIKSQSFGGGGSPSFAGGGGGTVGAVAASSTAGLGDGGGAPVDQGVAITINAEDDAVIDGRKLIDIINRATSDGKTLRSIRLGTTNV